MSFFVIRMSSNFISLLVLVFCSSIARIQSLRGRVGEEAWGQIQTFQTARPYHIERFKQFRFHMIANLAWNLHFSSRILTSSARLWLWNVLGNVLLCLSDYDTYNYYSSSLRWPFLVPVTVKWNITDCWTSIRQWQDHFTDVLARKDLDVASFTAQERSAVSMDLPLFT